MATHMSDTLSYHRVISCQNYTFLTLLISSSYIVRHPWYLSQHNIQHTSTSPSMNYQVPAYYIWPPNAHTHSLDFGLTIGL